MDKVIVTVPDYRLEVFLKSVDRLNKKAQKFGLESIEAKELRRFHKSHWRYEHVSIGYVELEVTKLSPKMGDWDFVGKLDGNGITNVFYNVPGKNIPETYREVDHAHCDHCNMNRKRTFTYVVQNRKTGQFQQVGRACLKDFVGHVDAERIAQWLMDVRSLVHEPYDRDEAAVAPIHQFYNVEHMLALGLHFIKIQGRYISRNVASDEGGQSTVGMVTDCFYSGADWQVEVQPIIDENIDQARDVVQFFQAMPSGDQDPFMLNIISAVNSIFCSYKALGVLMAALPVYHKLVTVKNRKPKASSKHIGVLGARIVKNLKLIRVCSHATPATMYDPAGGIGFWHHFEDEDGNVYKWDTSREHEAGKNYNLAFTIKKHGEFRGVKETVITRARIKD